MRTGNVVVGKARLNNSVSGTGNSDGITAEGNGTSVRGNRGTHNHTRLVKLQYVGLFMSEASACVSGGNRRAGNQNHPYYDTGTTNAVTDPLATSASWGPGTVANGATASTMVTVNEVILGDVAAGVSVARTADVLLFAAETAAGTVTVTVTPLDQGLGSMTPGTLAPRARLARRWSLPAPHAPRRRMGLPAHHAAPPRERPPPRRRGHRPLTGAFDSTVFEVSPLRPGRDQPKPGGSTLAPRRHGDDVGAN